MWYVDDIILVVKNKVGDDCGGKPRDEVTGEEADSASASGTVRVKVFS